MVTSAYKREGVVLLGQLIALQAFNALKEILSDMFLIEFLQRWFMRKYIWKHTQITNTFDTKIILYNYILY